MVTAAIIVAAFVIGAALIVGRLAWVHREDTTPRKLRRLGPLPPDPGLRPPPDVTKDPYRER
jgi:hypothetical protein